MRINKSDYKSYYGMNRYFLPSRTVVNDSKSTLNIYKDT